MKEIKEQKLNERKQMKAKTCNIDNQIFENNYENVKIRITHLKHCNNG